MTLIVNDSSLVRSSTQFTVSSNACCNMSSLINRRGTLRATAAASGRVVLRWGAMTIMLLCLALLLSLHNYASDRDSTTLLVLDHGQKATKRTTTQSTSLPLVIDILSIGSETRQDYQQAQEETFGSRVRSFIRATEQDDYETACHTNLTRKQVGGIIQFCHARTSKLHPAIYPTLQKMIPHYASRKWIFQKKKPDRLDVCTETAGGCFLQKARAIQVPRS